MSKQSSIGDPPEPSFADGMRRALVLLPLSLGFGLVVGAAATDAGLTTGQATAMSATVFAGAAQVGAIAVLGLGGSALAAVWAAALLNLRYVPMSLSIAGIMRGRAARRWAESQLLVDESWVLSLEGDIHHRRLLIGAGIALWSTFTIGTLVGSVSAEIVGDPSRLGLDGGVIGLFVAFLFPYLAKRDTFIVACLAATAALAVVPIVPVGLPITVATVGALYRGRR